MKIQAFHTPISKAGTKDMFPPVNYAVNLLPDIGVVNGSLTHLFNDEEKIHPMDPKRPHSNVGDYLHNLTIEVIQELL
jgi:hypothetical protein